MKTNKPEYSIWSTMKQRCYDKKSSRYYYYGERGTIICDRWKNSFEAFIEDMGARPKKDWHIHRIDPSGNYEPGNCIWIDPVEHRLIPHRPHRPQRSFMVHKPHIPRPRHRSYRPYIPCRNTKLTDRQAEIYAFLFFSYTIPTLQEIGTFFNMSRQGAQIAVATLERKGKLRVDHYKWRGIVLL